MSFDIAPLTFAEERFAVSRALIWLCRELSRARFVVVVVVRSRLSMQSSEWDRGLLLNSSGSGD
jgi:hypothetical protein